MLSEWRKKRLVERVGRLAREGAYDEMAQVLGGVCGMDGGLLGEADTAHFLSLVPSAAREVAYSTFLNEFFAGGGGTLGTSIFETVLDWVHYKVLLRKPGSLDFVARGSEAVIAGHLVWSGLVAGFVDQSNFEIYIPVLEASRLASVVPASKDVLSCLVDELERRATNLLVDSELEALLHEASGDKVLTWRILLLANIGALSRWMRGDLGTVYWDLIPGSLYVAREREPDTAFWQSFYMPDDGRDISPYLLYVPGFSMGIYGEEEAVDACVGRLAKEYGYDAGMAVDLLRSHANSSLLDVFATMRSLEAAGGGRVPQLLAAPVLLVEPIEHVRGLRFTSMLVEAEQQMKVLADLLEAHGGDPRVVAGCRRIHPGLVSMGEAVEAALREGVTAGLADVVCLAHATLGH